MNNLLRIVLAEEDPQIKIHPFGMSSTPAENYHFFHLFSV